MVLASGGDGGDDSGGDGGDDSGGDGGDDSGGDGGRSLREEVRKERTGYVSKSGKKEKWAVVEKR